MTTRQLVVGMPDTGKSTFIAALRHVLLAGTAATELVLTALADEEEHLNDLEADWLECRQVPRTRPATEGWVEFHLREGASGAQSVFSIPDLRGEAFEQPICASQCQRELYDAVSEAAGMLVFTSAERDDDLLISDLGDLLPPAGDRGETKPFDPYGMPEEVKAVEFLQMANRPPLRPRRRKIAVIVSAWDVVAADTVPGDWFAEHRPMLAQFLRYNSDLWDLRVYGVSAQGGRLPRDRKRLASIEPIKRISIVGHGAGAHDLTSPLRWLGQS